jgi:tRNA nucleotidyltransferase/poly(A) polymerase
MSDYFKLLDVPKELADASKVLILVADLNNSDDDLTRVLREIRFQSKEALDVLLSRGLVRMWQLS